MTSRNPQKAKTVPANLETAGSGIYAHKYAAAPYAVQILYIFLTIKTHSSNEIKKW